MRWATLARAFPRLRLHGQTPRVASIGHSTTRFCGVCPCHPPANFVLPPMQQGPQHFCWDGYVESESESEPHGASLRATYVAVVGVAKSLSHV